MEVEVVEVVEVVDVIELVDVVVVMDVCLNYVTGQGPPLVSNILIHCIFSVGCLFYIFCICLIMFNFLSGILNSIRVSSIRVLVLEYLVSSIPNRKN